MRFQTPKLLEQNLNICRKGCFSRTPCTTKFITCAKNFSSIVSLRLVVSLVLSFCKGYSMLLNRVASLELSMCLTLMKHRFKFRCNSGTHPFKDVHGAQTCDLSFERKRRARKGNLPFLSLLYFSFFFFTLLKRKGKERDLSLSSFVFPLSFSLSFLSSPSQKKR